MKRFVFTTVAATAITATGVAVAADLPMGTRAPPPGGLAPAPVFSWTGCYVGANVGVGSAHTQFRDPVPDGNIDAGILNSMMVTEALTNREAHTDSSGGVFGGQLGCDWQVSGSWVVGLQGTFSGSDISGTNQDQFNAPWTLSSTLDWYATITGRVGWAVNNVLIYGKGGGAWAHNKLEVENTGQFLGSPDVTPFGWTVGAGVEWAFAPSWSAFVEADYYGFGSTTSNLNFVPGFIQNPTTINTKLQFETLLVGVNYRFRGW